MVGYQTKLERISISGAEDLVICSLLDNQQHFDPFEQAVHLGISSASWPLFGLLWASEVHLATRLAARPILSGERILEVGCGLALASLVGHRLGANVTASDRHPLTSRFLRDNLRLNHLPPMKYRHGQWSDGAPGCEGGALARSITLGRYDLIIGSDLLYEQDASGTLAGFIDRHLMPNAEVLIVDPNRGNRPAFNRLMLANDFVLSEEPIIIASTLHCEAYRGRLLSYRRSAIGMV